jgi:DNA-binding Lrp family transcriptional regulator
MLQYMKMLDATNAKIIEGLGRYGPRNLLSLAKSIGLPPTTVTFRIKKLIEEGHLKIRARLDYSKLGLMRATLIAEALPGLEGKLQKLIENWLLDIHYQMLWKVQWILQYASLPSGKQKGT